MGMTAVEGSRTSVPFIGAAITWRKPDLPLWLEAFLHSPVHVLIPGARWIPALWSWGTGQGICSAKLASGEHGKQTVPGTRAWLPGAALHAKACKFCFTTMLEQR